MGIEEEAKIDVLQSIVCGDVDDVWSFVGWETRASMAPHGLLTSHLQLQINRQWKSCWNAPLSLPT